MEYNQFRFFVFRAGAKDSISSGSKNKTSSSEMLSRKKPKKDDGKHIILRSILHPQTTMNYVDTDQIDRAEFAQSRRANPFFSVRTPVWGVCLRKSAVLAGRIYAAAILLPSCVLLSNAIRIKVASYLYSAPCQLSANKANTSWAFVTASGWDNFASCALWFDVMKTGGILLGDRPMLDHNKSLSQ